MALFASLSPYMGCISRAHRTKANSGTTNQHMFFPASVYWFRTASRPASPSRGVSGQRPQESRFADGSRQGFYNPLRSCPGPFVGLSPNASRILTRGPGLRRAPHGPGEPGVVHRPSLTRTLRCFARAGLSASPARVSPARNFLPVPGPQPPASVLAVRLLCRWPCEVACTDWPVDATGTPRAAG